MPFRQRRSRAATTRRTVEVSEPELESYVLYGLRNDIPARVESIDVQLTEGAVAADTKLTFPPDSTGNPLVDAFVEGTHTFFLKGKLAASASRGRFELLEVKVDGIPVPNILIETLVAKYVNPKYPEVDLERAVPDAVGNGKSCHHSRKSNDRVLGVRGILATSCPISSDCEYVVHSDGQTLRFSHPAD